MRLLLELTQPLLELQRGEGQRDVRHEAGRGLLVGEVLLGAGHVAAEVGGAAAGAGRVRLAVPHGEGEGGNVYRRRGRGRRQRGIRDRAPRAGDGRWGVLRHAGLSDPDGGRLIGGNLLLQGEELGQHQRTKRVCRSHFSFY